jgi:hypothetical protein
MAAAALLPTVTRTLPMKAVQLLPTAIPMATAPLLPMFTVKLPMETATQLLLQRVVQLPLLLSIPQM